MIDTGNILLGSRVSRPQRAKNVKFFRSSFPHSIFALRTQCGREDRDLSSYLKHFLLLFSIVTAASGLACQPQTSLAREQPKHTTLTADKRESGADTMPQRATLKLPLKDPRIVVFKSRRRLELYSDGALVRTYKVGLGLNPVPDKVRQGDRATPEGDFYVFTKNDKSAYYLSLGLSYPNIEDAERGLRDHLISRAEHDAIVKAIKGKAKPPQHTELGGDIYIHGNGSRSDWTWGCVALDNEDVKELFGAIAVGTPVTIKP